jgi:viroplasmin and RNaseH domain-containing protein
VSERKYHAKYNCDGGCCADYGAYDTLEDAIEFLRGLDRGVFECELSDDYGETWVSA